MHTSAQCLRGGVFAPSSVTALSFILPQMSFTACHWIRRGEAADKNRIAALKHQRGCTKQFSFAGECNYLHRAADEIETFSHPPTSPVTCDVGSSDAAWGGLSVWRCGHVCGGVYYCLSGWLRGVYCDTDGAVPKKKCQHGVIPNNTQPH